MSGEGTDVGDRHLHAGLGDSPHLSRFASFMKQEGQEEGFLSWGQSILQGGHSLHRPSLFRLEFEQGLHKTDRDKSWQKDT